MVLFGSLIIGVILVFIMISEIFVILGFQFLASIDLTYNDIILFESVKCGYSVLDILILTGRLTESVWLG